MLWLSDFRPVFRGIKKNLLLRGVTVAPLPLPRAARPSFLYEFSQPKIVNPSDEERQKGQKLTKSEETHFELL